MCALVVIFGWGCYSSYRLPRNITSCYLLGGREGGGVVGRGRGKKKEGEEEEEENGGGIDIYISTGQKKKKKKPGFAWLIHNYFGT